MDRKAIILVAGMGTRLKPLTNVEHKCMTKVCGVPIIKNTLIELEKNGFSEVILVVGYLKERLEQQIRQFALNLKITFVENPIYDKTNTVYSLKKGLEKVSVFDELYVIEGDVFFEDKVLQKLIQEKCKNATVLEKYNSKLEGTFAEINAEQCVVDWRHKSEQEDGYRLEDKYKTVNLHKFSFDFVEKILKREMIEFIGEKGCNQPFEKVMRKIVKKNISIMQGVILQGEKWYEIDDLQDLKVAEKIFE